MDDWGDAANFWTDDDRSGVDSDEEAEVTHDPLLPPSSPEDTPAWLKEFEAEREKLEDVVGFSSSFLSAPQTQPAHTIERPTGVPGRLIRKRWVLEDHRDVSNFNEVLPVEQRAIVHPFELDPFQKRAILHVEKGEHVFVCAHTSAGKTVVAEYAIALAAKNNMRAIYTSPIKALSNQKFREFSKLFPSVGIITGDVSVNTQAQCLIMTTEILRSLLYRGDALLSQVAVVIYDEVHYVNDPDRGVVWEETIILLNQSISMVMLSATVPNYLQFAEWIGTTKQREVFAVSTTYRPTPLRHYLWANDRAYLLLDARNQFNTGAYNMIYNDTRAAQKAKDFKAAAAKGKGKAKAQVRPPAPKYQTYEARQKTEKQRLQKFLEFLQEKEGLPVVCFCFSRKRCEQLASSMPQFLNVSADTKSKCHVFIKQSLSGLSDDDRGLPQLKFIESLVSRGIGVHHGGLLPLVKEMIEILFSKGLIQVLFATETFAMGVNMPARSVMLTAINKHDGRRNRPLYSSEYIQIAGRAGRRGLDTCGNVYIFSGGEQLPNHSELAAMMLHKATPLQSRFRLTFAMLLQLVVRQGFKPVDMIARSFKETVRAQQLPLLKRDLVRRQKELDQLDSIECIFGEPDIEDYVKTELECRLLGQEVHRALLESKFSREVFAPGRIVLLHSLPFLTTVCHAMLMGRSQPRVEVEAGESNANASRASYRERQNATPVSGEFPTFTCLLLIPRGSKLYEDEALLPPKTRLESDTLLSILTQAGAVQRAKAEIVYHGDLAGAAGLDDSDDVEAAIRLGKGKYVPARGYAVVKNVPLYSIGSLMNEVVPLPHDDWSLGSPEEDQAQKVDTPTERSIAVGQASDAPAVEISMDQKLHWTRCAQTFDDFVVERWSSMTSFVIPKKMRHIEVEHVMNASELRLKTQRLTANKCHLCPKRETHMRLQLRRRELLEDISNIQYRISDASLDLVPDMYAKLEFLKSRGFIEENGAIALKGRSACELLATDEVTLVEALFGRILQDLSPPAIVAVVSAFVFPESSDDEPVLFSEEVDQARIQIEEIHDEIGRDLMERGIQFDPEDWRRLCNFKFSFVAFLWASGESFTKVMEKTTLQEGTIVRTIIRLDEVIRKLRNVAHLIGNLELKGRMEEASARIHRDIVFTSSLYLQ